MAVGLRLRNINIVLRMNGNTFDSTTLRHKLIEKRKRIGVIIPKHIYFHNTIVDHTINNA